MESYDKIPVPSYERMLRRLLVLNDYGYTIEHYGSKELPQDFLTDEWLEAWYGKDWCKSYVQDELDAIDLLMSAR